MTRSIAFIIAISLILMSCASAPPKKDLVSDTAIPPDRITEPQAAEIDSAWWAGFNDDQLNNVIAEAINQNHNLALAAANLQVAAAQAKIAGAPLYPQANLSFNGARTKQNFIGLPIPGSAGGVLSSTTTSYGVAMNVSWELDLWGRLRGAAAAALSQLQATHVDYIGARLSLAGQVTKGWFAAIEARGQMELSQATTDNWRESFARVRQRYERGLTSSLDLRLSQSSLSIAEANLSLSESLSESVLRQLETLLGRYPSASLALSPELPLLSQSVPLGLPADLLRRRPDLAAAERRFAATQANISSARAALLPQISLTGSGGTSSKELKDLLDGDFSVWSLAGNLLQPIFQGGRLRAGVSLAEAQGDIAAIEYQRLALNAFAEVENALSNERHLGEQERALTEATRQAIAARELAETQYTRGLINFVTLLESQRAAYDNQRQLLTIRRQRLEARIDLYLALGGGFTVLKTSSQP